MRRPILLNWQANTTFGWGLLGVNILQHWARDGDIQPLMGFPIAPGDLEGIDPLRIALMLPAALASNQFLEQLAAGGLDLRTQQMVVVDSVSNGLRPPEVRRIGSRNVARCVFEDTRLDQLDQKLAGYDALLCASNWAARLLREKSTKPVILIQEGIDHSQFFPGPRSDLTGPDRFYIFSGGKIEYRKGHDLLLLAFREFAARHRDAVLVAAWQSPWPHLAVGFQGRLPFALQKNAQGNLDLQRWVGENGIPANQFVELPMMPNSMMPLVLREMDCAVQVSRCEACTSLPATEAMATGLPVILADNTGLKDLIGDDNCIAMRSQRPITVKSGPGTEGWGESQVEEIVAALETLYSDTQLRRRVGARGAQWILERRRTWRDHSAILKSALLEL